MALRSRERRAGGNPPQFQHTMTNVAVLGQMGRCDGFAAAGHHLVYGPALPELRIKLAAKLARPAGTGVETTDDGLINVFHERRLLRERKRVRFTMGGGVTIARLG